MDSSGYGFTEIFSWDLVIIEIYFIIIFALGCSFCLLIAVNDYDCVSFSILIFGEDKKQKKEEWNEHLR